jgi:hypothetical protein
MGDIGNPIVGVTVMRRTVYYEKFRECCAIFRCDEKN